MVRKVKKSIQVAMYDTNLKTVMANRISWKKFDKMRTATLVELKGKKRKNDDRDEDMPPAKRTHTGNLDVEEHNTDVQNLLEEAQSWSPNKVVNWSDLARQCGITRHNGGQVLKEIMKKHGIVAASLNQREQRRKRRSRQLLPGVPFPMAKTSKYQKHKLQSYKRSGKILCGEKVVETQYTKHVINESTSTISEVISTFTAQKIRLIDIRRKLLEMHEKLGLLHNQPDDYFEKLTDAEVKTQLEKLGEKTEGTPDELKAQLKSMNRTRHLKIWHDHSTISGHNHLLVTVACVYDPAFYHTPEEVGGKDVQTIIERPEIHILGRSGSSLQDQALFNNCRLECIQELSTPLHTTTGIQVIDTLRFFHGDGPAQQYEAGNSFGGTYPCVQCGVASEEMSELECAYKCQTRSLKERQEFILEGQVWKKGGINIYDKLKVKELRQELKSRHIETRGLNRDEMDSLLKSLRMGITNLPALLQPHPTSLLNELQLSNYEISPTEPLHDIKSHFANIFEEAESYLQGDVLDEFKKLRDSVLCKSTLRCSDYQKAMVILYNTFREKNIDQTFKDILRTAVDLSHLVYSRDYDRTPKTALALHNTSFMH